MTAFQNSLESLINKNAQDFSIEAIEKMNQHYDMMLKWNKTHNLTRIVSLDDAVRKHYLDCILGFNFVSESETLYDMGSGAGFPGIIGGILRPQQNIFLVEPARKRATFLTQAKSALDLKNVHIINERAEAIQNAEAIISRGTFSWPTIAPLLDPLMPVGKLYLWIGQNPPEETFCGAIRELGHDPSWGSYDLGQAGLRHMGMVSKRAIS